MRWTSQPRNCLRFLLVVSLPAALLALGGCPAPQPGDTDQTEEVELTPETKVITEESSLQVSTVDEDSLVVTATGDESVQVGDILTGSSNGQAYLRKVVRLEEQADGSMMAITEQAALDEVIAQGATSVSQTLSFANGGSAGKTKHGMQKTLALTDHVLLDQDGVTVTFKELSLDYDPTVDLGFDFSLFGGLEYFRALASGTLDIDATVEMSVSDDVADYDYETTLYTQPGPPIDFVIGVVPVHVCTTLEINAGVHVGASANGSASFQSGLTVDNSAGVEYSDGEWKALNNSGFDFDSPSMTYELGGAADARVYVQAKLILSFYCVAGPYLSVTGNLGFDGEADLEKIAWELYWSVVAGAGGDVNVISDSLPELDLDIYAWRETIAQGETSTSEGGGTSEPETVLTADFRQETIAETDCTTQTSETYYNSYYDECWRMTSPGYSNITVQFELDALPTSASLWITHLSSANEFCRGGGYAPIDLSINGTVLLDDYDVAEHHDTFHGYATDGWPIVDYLVAGSNTIRIEYEDTACTHYWIQLLEVSSN